MTAEHELRKGRILEALVRHCYYVTGYGTVCLTLFLRINLTAAGLVPMAYPANFTRNSGLREAMLPIFEKHV